MNDSETTRNIAVEADKPIALRLRDIACWQLPELAQRNEQDILIKPPILPGLPSLQRGAVWKPNQIELLWDSVLRGFPIGSMVVCKKLGRQATRAGAVAGGTDSLPWPEGDYTYHLLDGQQRANAVALGYLDPLPARDPDTLLWLDLDPDQPNSSRFPAASSRRFLLRVTTVAHPWGFKISDDKDPKRLEHHNAKAADEAFRAIHPTKVDERPRPRDGWPFDANVPIPMAWALEEAHTVYNDKEEAPTGGQPEGDLWRRVLKRCESFQEVGGNCGRSDPASHSGAPTKDQALQWWATRATNLLRRWVEAFSGTPEPQALHLARALARAVKAQTVALQVPDDALTQASRTEMDPDATDPTANRQNISNAEHLFQRLNGGGTVLDGDELRFSMIKAYWPGIETTIQSINPRPPDTQVALLGARLVLGSGNHTFPAAPTVETLRGLATAPNPGLDGGQGEEHKRVRERREARDRLEDGFGLRRPIAIAGGTDPTLGTPSAAPVAQAFAALDEWFLYRPEQRWGLPKVVRSRLAEQAPEVFLFLLRLAWAHGPGSPPDEAIRRKLLGLATALHWFGTNRAAAARHLWKIDHTKWLDGTAFTAEPKLLITLRALPSENPPNTVRTVADIMTPDELARYIDETTFDRDMIETWNWWRTLVVAPTENAPGPDADPKARETAINNRWAQYKDFLGVLNRKDYRGTNALLLMYAQREQMDHCFNSYDPSRVGYWDLHNTPWDFDHILPQDAFYNRKQRNTYVEVCKEWGYTIANLHIWPFELNRSRGADTADPSLPGDENELRRMLLWVDSDAEQEHDRRPFFSLEGRHVDDSDDDRSLSREKVHDFIVDARSRLLRIYRDWFDTLSIQDLL